MHRALPPHLVEVAIVNYDELVSVVAGDEGLVAGVKDRNSEGRMYGTRV